MLLRDRFEAGVLLGPLLARYADDPGLVVLGVPNNGVAVAFELARALAAPLDVVCVRSVCLASPRPIGRVASGRVCLLDEAHPDRLALGPSALCDAIAGAHGALERAEREYRRERAAHEIHGASSVVLVDDAARTGATLRAALAAVHAKQPARVVVAVGVATPEARAALRDLVADFHCLDEAADIAGYYHGAHEPTDAEVADLLDLGAEPVAAA